MAAFMKMLTILLLAVVTLAAGQTANSTTNCSESLATEYLVTVNNITDSMLTTFGNDNPRFRPLTTPLAVGLAVNPLFLRPFSPGNISVSDVNDTVTINRLGMSIFADTLLTMLDKWNISADHYPTSSDIMRINEITRVTLADLGRKYPGLRRLTDPLPSALSFSAFTLLGSSLFNFGLDPATVESNLQMLSGNLTAMASQWANTTAHYLQQQQLHCHQL